MLNGNSTLVRRKRNVERRIETSGAVARTLSVWLRVADLALLFRNRDARRDGRELKWPITCYIICPIMVILFLILTNCSFDEDHGLWFLLKIITWPRHFGTEDTIAINTLYHNIRHTLLQKNIINSRWCVM
jgi:hypothetical protein